MKNESEMIERAFIRLIVSALQKRSMNFSEFAVQVWPDIPKKTAVGKFRQLREPSTRTGKHQNLSLSAAAQMAKVLGMELSYVIVVAKEEVLKQIEGQTAEGLD